jgi:hypothetical protein
MVNIRFIRDIGLQYKKDPSLILAHWVVLTLSTQYFILNYVKTQRGVYSGHLKHVILPRL